MGFDSFVCVESAQVRDVHVTGFRARGALPRRVLDWRHDGDPLGSLPSCGRVTYKLCEYKPCEMSLSTRHVMSRMSLSLHNSLVELQKGCAVRTVAKLLQWSVISVRKGDFRESSGENNNAH